MVGADQRQPQGHRAIKDGKGASAEGGGGWGEGGGGVRGGEDDDDEVSREAIGAFVSGLLTVLCSCVGQMLELTNREVRRGRAYVRMYVRIPRVVEYRRAHVFSRGA